MYVLVRFSNDFIFESCPILNLNDYIYKPIITKALFDQCEDIRTGRAKPHARYGSKQFLFRGLITCTHTGKLCTAQEHKKTYKNGKEQSFTYLVSFDKDNPKKTYYTREEDVLKQVEDAFALLTISGKGELKDILSYINKAYFEKRSEYKNHIIEFRREYNDLDYKIDQLTHLRLNNELTSNEYRDTKKRFRNRQFELKALLEAYETTDDDFTNKLNYFIELAADALNEFRSSSFDQKRELMNYVFQNLQLDGKKLVYSMASPFDTIAQCNQTGQWCLLVDIVRTCKEVRGSILSMAVPYWKPLKVA